jgi:hypothetical protein
VVVLPLFNSTVNMALQGAWILCSEGFNGARVCNFHDLTMISCCVWMSDRVCVDIVINLLIGAKLLLSTDAYELFKGEAD